MVNTEEIESAKASSEIDLQFDAKTVRYGVLVGGLRLFLPSQTLNEVVNDGEIYPVPNTPRWFRGVINHRGNIVSVFDLKDIFFDEVSYTQQENQSHILVVGKGDGAVGILVDTLPQVINIEKTDGESQVKIPDILERHLIIGGSSGWVEVDFSGLFEEIGGLILL